MKHVLVFKSELLHFSETFIRQQLLAYSEWRPTLVGMRRVPGLTLDGLEVRMLDYDARRGYGRAMRLLSLAPPEVVRSLRGEAATLAHAHFGTDAVDFWPIARRLGVPLIVTLHGYDITVHRDHWERGAGGLMQRLYPRRLIRMSRSPRVHFVAVSEAIRQSAIDFGLDPARIHVNYIGIDRGQFAAEGPPIPQRPRRILYVGRLVEKKGVRYLIEAFARVRAKVPDAELIIVGDGTLRSELEALARQLRVPVSFAGYRTAAEVKAHLDCARVFCLPSVTARNGDAEGFGLVLLEAQAAGVPVVTSARGGAREGLLAGVTGLPVGERDVDELALCLTMLLTDDVRAERMGRAASRFVADRFDLRRCTRNLERLYDDASRFHVETLP